MLRVNHSLLLLANRLVVAAVGVLSVKIYTTVLPVADVGHMAYFLAYCQFASMFAVYPAGSYFLRYMTSWRETGELQLNARRYLLRVVGGSLIAGSLAVGLAATGLLNIRWSVVSLFVVTVFHLTALPIKETFLAALNINGETRRFAVLTLVSSLMALCASWTLCHYAPTAIAWLFPQTVVFLLTGAMAMKGGTRESPGTPEAKVSTIPYSGFVWPLIVTALGTWLLSDSGKFIIERIGGPEGLAYVAVAVNVGGAIVLIVERIVIDLLSPRLFNMCAISKAKAAEAWQSYNARIMVTCFSAALLVSAAAPMITAILLGGMFKNLNYWIAFGAFIRVGIATLVSAQVFTQLVDRPKMICFHPYIGAGAGLALLLWFYDGHHLIGAMLPLLISVLLSVGLAFLTLKVNFAELNVLDLRVPRMDALIIIVGLVAGWTSILVAYGSGRMLLLGGIADVIVLWLSRRLFRRRLLEYRNWFLGNIATVQVGPVLRADPVPSEAPSP